MVIENILYFALGALVAGLLALIILPAVWKRAVRLTKRRIEAATPITMAEFRADKDQLRAEFALSTRRLEQTIDQLRKRLAEQLSEGNQTRTDLGALQTERDKHLVIVKELEARGAALHTRNAELERENTDLAQRLRMRERELDTRNAELDELREATGGKPLTKAGAAAALTDAEARIASAETRLNALLAETAPASPAPAEQLLADKLNLDDDVEALRKQVLGVENAIAADWGTDRADENSLRDRLARIAASVSRIVYAADTGKDKPSVEESLFDRVQRFADDSLDDEPSSQGERPGTVSNRMAALQELQGR